jgi:uncharacterized protein (TIGR00255 family)
MTGFARLRRTGAAGEVVVSVKSVNHRGLDMHFHLPDEFDPFEQDLRAAVKRRAIRGHFQIEVTFSPARSTAGPALNRPLLASYLAAFRQAQEELGLSGEPDLNAALTLPGMFRDSIGSEPGEDLRQLLLGAFEQAMDSLNEFREREGGQIAAEMRARAAAVGELAVRMEEMRGRAIPAFQARLSERLNQLLEGAPVEPQRLAQEVAILVDRSDIGEELSRLKIHAAEVEQLLAGGGEVGKKLDFLMQEMNRETNTVLSKTNGAGALGLSITSLALAARAEIEKIREQSLNLE